MLRINVAASAGAGAVNEDVAGHYGDAAWVIDGATGVGVPILSGTSDAAWFANRVSIALEDILRDRPAIATHDLLIETITTCRTAFESAAQRTTTDAAELPSAAFAMVRQIGESVEFTTLGDCRIAYRDEAGSAALFGGTAIAPFEARSIALADDLRRRDPKIDPVRLKIAMLPRLRETRRLMNRPGGYWILGTDPAAADHVEQVTLKTTPGDTFALASDGFLRLIEIFGVAGAADLLAIDTRAQFDAHLARLRGLESAPDTLSAHPRIKAHDDVSFVQCTYRLEA